MEAWASNPVKKNMYSAVTADHQPWHGLPFSLSLTLPPLGVIWLEVPQFD